MKYKFFTLPIICLLLFMGRAFSQPTVSGLADEFTYDGAGNRIKREYHVTIIAPKNSYHEEQRVDTLKERSDNKLFAGSSILVKAYPNPVADEMIVENLSWKNGSIATVKISDIAGRLLQEKTFRTAKEGFSLSTYIVGTYTVSYYLDNHLYTTWKIIKK
jgi:hypothetical protein